MPDAMETQVSDMEDRCRVCCEGVTLLWSRHAGIPLSLWWVSSYEATEFLMVDRVFTWFVNRMPHLGFLLIVFLLGLCWTLVSALWGAIF